LSRRRAEGGDHFPERCRRGAGGAGRDAASSSQAREDLRRLADEQAALRRVATLVARGVPGSEVFAAVTEEVAWLFGADFAGMSRYESDDTRIVVARWPKDLDHLRVDTRLPIFDGVNLARLVMQTGQPARIDDWDATSGASADIIRELGVRSSVGSPIVVGGRLWGVLSVDSRRLNAFPRDTERRLASFAELVATAVANTQVRADLGRLADEQAGLRRVATLVAEGTSPGEVFAALAREIGLVLGLPLVGMFRYEGDGSVTVVGAMGEHPFRPGSNWPVGGGGMAAVVRGSGRAVRVESGVGGEGVGFGMGVAAPIVVDGQVWGVVCAGAAGRGVVVPVDGERRLSEFTALVATAISNAQAREDLRRLADEQAALRRLATLVAQDAEPRVVFDAVCEETGRVLGASSVELACVGADGVSVMMAGWRAGDGGGVGVGSEVAAAVVVEGRVWGALSAAGGRDRLRAGTEVRLAGFAELIATAVSNAAARAELVDSRVRIVEAADEQRRRVVRDLHDGAQSRLIHTVIALERARGQEGVPVGVREFVEEGLMHAHAAIGELRDLAHGIHPAMLTHNGLAAAVEVLGDRAPVVVRVDIPGERYPMAVESAAYFVAAEALTNVVKYADASLVAITATRTAGRLRLVVEDDGVGGAVLQPGAGLAGVGDRLAALDGELSIDSPPGGGTRIRADIPLPAAQ
jgi:signal transduction histidine kinase/putative methionine-R-sulfoxide reductase with GAF domain